MAKLYFRHGAVGSAKTLNLLAVAHNYEQQGKRAYLIKPALDERFGQWVIRSRAGLERPADLLVADETVLDHGELEGVSCVLVDEAQFLPATFIDQLRDVTVLCGVPVICYGLRTDFKTQLFEGSRRLFEVADIIQEIKTTCAFCERAATWNLKLVGGKATATGPIVELGCEERYLPACAACYRRELQS